MIKKQPGATRWVCSRLLWGWFLKNRTKTEGKLKVIRRFLAGHERKIAQAATFIWLPELFTGAPSFMGQLKFTSFLPPIFFG
ncbi:hypothetical protein ACFSC6_17130 [Rufibacter sediminis]|uniref:Uncharacterized protein n=1 Tax=Rufibacter sediminis TaxID=2762756 RepID=A0ABR6VWN2_9BACT|nr:hypothetical protein [Rufibacter sediminis]MBC3541026.1 hypothetical protein [Rufibacter sediminis]